jgi:hypothetical protein
VLNDLDLLGTEPAIEGHKPNCQCPRCKKVRRDRPKVGTPESFADLFNETTPAEPEKGKGDKDENDEERKLTPAQQAKRDRDDAMNSYQLYHTIGNFFKADERWHIPEEKLEEYGDRAVKIIQRGRKPDAPFLHVFLMNVVLGNEDLNFAGIVAAIEKEHSIPILAVAGVLKRPHLPKRKPKTGDDDDLDPEEQESQNDRIARLAAKYRN